MSSRVAMVIGLVALSSHAIAATLRVPQQFATIQAAVDAAAPGDTVLVGPGHYVEHVLVQKSLDLRSTGGAVVTTIDGGNIGAPLAVWGTLTEIVSISGFTLTGGAFILDTVEVEYPNQWGAGLFVDSVAKADIHHNVISGNRGCGGTGIRVYETNVRIHDNVVRGNQPMEWCPGNGEAVRLGGSGTLTDSRSATVERNQIVGNGGVGLWMVAFDSISVRGNTITDNFNTMEGGPYGGGMDLAVVSGLVADNFVARNRNLAHPAMVLVNYLDPVHNLLVIGNRFVDNLTDSSSGGVALLTFAPSASIFVGNHVVGSSEGNLISCTGEANYLLGNLILNRNPGGTSTDCLR